MARLPTPKTITPQMLAEAKAVLAAPAGWPLDALKVMAPHVTTIQAAANVTTALQMARDVVAVGVR